MTALSGPDRDQLRREMTAAVLDIEPGSRSYPDVVVAALLPVVEAHTRARVAGALRGAGDGAARNADATLARALFTRGPQRDRLHGEHAAYTKAAAALHQRAEKALRTHEGDTDGRR